MTAPPPAWPDTWCAEHPVPAHRALVRAWASALTPWRVAVWAARDQR